MTDTIPARDTGTGTDGGLRSINATLTSREYLRAMWARREFAVEVPLEEMRSAHKTTLLGNVWHLGNPLLTIAVYYLIFGTLLKGNRPDNFLLWLTVGVFAFRATQSSIQGGARSLTTNSGLMRAIRFPRSLLPVSAVVSNLLTFAIELVVLGLIVLGFGFGVSKRWLLLPAALAVHMAFNLGSAFIAARLNDKYRDIEQLIPFIFQLFRYLSSVMVPIAPFIASDRMPAILKGVLIVNPMYAIIQFYRWIFLRTEVATVDVARTAVIAALMLWFGFRFFRAAEWRYGRS